MLSAETHPTRVGFEIVAALAGEIESLDVRGIGPIDAAVAADRRDRFACTSLPVVVFDGKAVLSLCVFSVVDSVSPARHHVPGTSPHTTLSVDDAKIMQGFCQVKSGLSVLATRWRRCRFISVYGANRQAMLTILGENAFGASLKFAGDVGGVATGRCGLG